MLVMTHPPGHGVLALIPRKELVRLLVVLPELLDDVLAHVAVLLLDLAGNLELVLGRDVDHFAALTEEVEHELRDVAAGDGDVLDCGADHIALSDGYDVRDTVTGVNDGAGQGALCDLAGCPGCSEGEYSLDGDVQSRDVERFEEDFGRVLAILGRVEWRFRLRYSSAQVLLRAQPR